MSFVNLTSHLFGGKLVIFLKEERKILDIQLVSGKDSLKIKLSH